MHVVKKKVINSMILVGNRQRAFRWYGYINVWIKLVLGVEGWFVIERALNNIRPLVGLTSIRVGGVRYKVPVSITFVKGLGRSVGWLFRGRAGFRRMGVISIYKGIVGAFFGRGVGVVRLREWYRLAARNRMYVKFIGK